MQEDSDSGSVQGEADGVTQFISRIVDVELKDRLENPFQGVSLQDFGSRDEWNELLSLGLGSFLADLIAQFCIQGLDAKYPELGNMRAAIQSVKSLPTDMIGFDEPPNEEFLLPAQELYDHALTGRDTEGVRESIDQLSVDGQANVILNTLGIFTVLSKVFHQVASGELG